MIRAGTLLGFFSAEKLVSFSVYQYTDGLVFQRQIRDAQAHQSELHIYIDEVFHQGRQAFVTITSSAQGTAVYVDGVLAGRSTRLGLSSRDLTGQLVVGNSPVADDSWSGDISGLAIFNRELTATEVLEHFNSWKKNGRPESSGKGNPLALYLFDERAGSLIHNRAGSAPDLTIPDHYLIFRPVLLKVPWKEFQKTWSYLEDVLVNIGGFIPFGFVFCAYFSSSRHLRRARLITILLGFTVSLTIEILQAYLPTRSSGMTDLFTNTLGTAIGVMIFQWKSTQAIFSRVGIPMQGEKGGVEAREVGNIEIPAVPSAPAGTGPEVEVREVGDVAILKLTGQFNEKEQCDIILEKIQELLRANKKKILLNLNGIATRYFNVHGALVRACGHIRRQGGELKLVPVSKEQMTALRMVQLDKHIEVYSSEEEGLASFSRTGKDTVE